MAQAVLDHASGEVGPILRRWRATRGKSQLDLAMTSQISQRHVSFIESGRSRPSKSMLITIADALDIPFRERNTLLLAGGYAPAYADGAWEGDDMTSVNAAIDRMLHQQEPFPAMAPSRNLLRLLFDPDGLRPHVAEWESLASAMIGRVHREAVGYVLDAQVQQLLRELLAYPGVRSEWQRGEAASSLPLVPIGLIHEGAVIRYFSMVCTIGTPQTVLTQELRLECMFPADKASEERHLALSAPKR
jgi:transcriptional regulator with XRE-family HTH domain